jgi:DNA-3-methyladenine glycosylase I
MIGTGSDIRVIIPNVAKARKHPSLARGADGKRRCWWGQGSDEYVGYHDREWGRPVTDDDGLFERLVLEGFQSGLSWLTILRKRDAFRDAFAGFQIGQVAGFGRRDVKRLMGDAGIVRNRRKIDAAIENARAAIALAEDGDSLSRFVWSFRPRRHRAPRSAADLAATTPESAALSRELKARGFRFVGPTTAYALMQACGLVNDHISGCAVRREVSDEQRRAALMLPPR